MKKIILPICILLTGCMSANITQYDNITKEKKISVTRTTSGLSNSLINSLYAKNYDVYVKNKNTDAGYITTNSNYELLLDSYGYDICFVGGTAYSFSLSIIDLSNSKEIFNYSGNGCQDTIVSNFEKLITNENIESGATTEVYDLRPQK